VRAPEIQPDRLDTYLKSHLIDPALLRADDFNGFMRDRQHRLLDLIDAATGQKVDRADRPEDGQDVEGEDDTTEAKLTMSAAA
jgi:hypothetical protein